MHDPRPGPGGLHAGGVRRARRACRASRGVTLGEALAVLAAAAVLLALTVPALAGVRGPSGIAVSLENLRVLGIADATYAADWNDRQWTAINDTIGAYGNSAFSGFIAYNAAQGGSPADRHPPITLGWTPIDGIGPPVFLAYRTGVISNARLAEPIVFSGSSFAVNGSFGSFRFINDGRFTPYVSGRFYDERFYPPTDAIVRPVVEPLFDAPYAYVDLPPTVGYDGNFPFFAGYSRSAAAMFDPAIMEGRRLTRRGPVGGWLEPWGRATSFRSPTRSQARHPGLKTSILEHHWLQGVPEDPCNPGFQGGTYDGCEPYYFNHGTASAPATLFFDGSTRLLPTTEVMAGDALVREASGGSEFDGLWSRSTPFGQDGYFNDVSFDGPDVSHHVLTADGILGRDTLGIGAFDAPSVPRRRSALRHALDAVSGLVAPRRVPLTTSPMGTEPPVDPLPPRR